MTPAARCGILLVDKPAGCTSHDVVMWVRWALRERSVGHFGTLDPAATGLLVVGVGTATRLGPFLTGLDKRYRARIVLGRATTTADAEGETIEEAPCPAGSLERAQEEARALQGSLHLPPPAVSAIRIEGRRAHARVRAGEDVTLAPRPMTVHAVDEVTARIGETPGTVEVDLTAHVSKGTYVRSLAVELGRRLGLPAHLGALRRLAVGTLSLHGPDEVVAGLRVDTGPSGHARVVLPAPEGASPRDAAAARLHGALRPPTTGLPMPVCVLRPTADGAALGGALQHGQAKVPGPEAVTPELPSSGPAAVVAPAPGAPGEAPELLAIVEVTEGGTVRPRRLLLAPKGAPPPA